MLVGKQGTVKDLMGLSFVLGAVGSLVTGTYWRNTDEVQKLAARDVPVG